MLNFKFKPLTLLFLVALVLSIITPIFSARTLAASDGDLVQVGSGQYYLIEGNLKRRIVDNSIIGHMCWSGIKHISQSELNAHPDGPTFTRVLNYGGAVYLLQNCQKRYVPSAASLEWNGFSLSENRYLNTNTFKHWSYGSTLTIPKLMRTSSSPVTYFVDIGVRRAIKDTDTWNAWRFKTSDVVTNNKVLDFPQGSNLTKLVQFNSNIYAVDSGTFRYAGSWNHVKLNGYNPADLVSVGSDASSYIPKGASLTIPGTIQDLSTGKRYLVDNGELREIVSDYAFGEWGLNRKNIKQIPALYGGLKSVGLLDRLVKDAGGTYWLAWRGARRRIPDQTTFNDYGFNASDASPISNEFLRSRKLGSPLDRGVESYQGYKIPATTGKTAREQHLYLSTTEYNLGRSGASLTHYRVSSTPDAAKNGMAGGYGAFGSSLSPAPVDRERYYINMRWHYATWYEDCNTKDSFGKCTTRARNLSIGNKNWHRGKKIIVKNPANDRRVVVSVEESGPAIWTGRVSGLSPEAMLALGASTNNVLNYGWAVNQSLPLGRLY